MFHEFIYEFGQGCTKVPDAGRAHTATRAVAPAVTVPR